ncbi:MAG: glycine zipper family protein [Marinibacterium sp.]
MLSRPRFALVLAVPLLGFAAGCENTGANYQPVIDGPVGANYGGDLAACQQLAAQQGALGSDTGQNVAAGAGAAALGTAIVNNRGSNVRDAAAVGAIAGLAGSALQQEQKKEAIIRNCMRGRGYNVVG